MFSHYTSEDINKKCTIVNVTKTRNLTSETINIRKQMCSCITPPFW